jgi:hypothetical protein
MTCAHIIAILEAAMPSAADILTPLITAGAAVLAVIIGNKLSYTRSYNEKIWDLRRLAYSLILSELGEVESVCNNADEYIAENSYRYFETIEQKDNAKIAQHFELINKRIAQDYLILSRELACTSRAKRG